MTLEELDELSEEGYDEAARRRAPRHLMRPPGPSVLCSHRPVLPELFGLLGIDEEPLSPASWWSCHHRKGRLVATERHLRSERGQTADLRAVQMLDASRPSRQPPRR